MAGEVVQCPHCRAPAEVPAGFRGGLVNCARCGKVVEVGGLRDPLWLLLRVGAVVAVVALAALVGARWSPALGVLVGALAALASWGLSRAL